MRTGLLFLFFFFTNTVFAQTDFSIEVTLSQPILKNFRKSGRIQEGAADLGFGFRTSLQKKMDNNLSYYFALGLDYSKAEFYYHSGAKGPGGGRQVDFLALHGVVSIQPMFSIPIKEHAFLVRFGGVYRHLLITKNGNSGQINEPLDYLKDNILNVIGGIGFHCRSFEKFPFYTLVQYEIPNYVTEFDVKIFPILLTVGLPIK